MNPEVLVCVTSFMVMLAFIVVDNNLFKTTTELSGGFPFAEVAT